MKSKNSQKSKKGRHAYSFPGNIREAVRKHIKDAIQRVAPEQFGQEWAYTSALAISLKGIAYDGEDGFVEFLSTMVDDHGRNTAESWSGADFAITANISDKRRTINKAILLQVKLGAISKLPQREKERLKQQVKKMMHLTKAPKIMEIIESNGKRQPKIISGKKFFWGERYKSYELADYFIARVLTTLDGNTRSSFVRGVSESSLAKLKVYAKLKDKK